MGSFYKISFPSMFFILFFIITAGSSGQIKERSQTTRIIKNQLSDVRPVERVTQTEVLNKIKPVIRQKLSSMILKPEEINGNIYFAEDFDGIPGVTSGGAGTYSFPSGWNLVNNDHRTPDAQVAYVNEAWERREDFNFNVTDSAAFSTSWYSPIGQADDWMISPPITIGNFARLTWNAVTYDPLYRDGYEVRISTTTQTIAGCTANPVLFSTAAENTSWTQRYINLDSAGYSNQTIYLAWRNNSNDKFLLLIDDIAVEEVLDYDAEITGITLLSEYTMQPQWQMYPLQMGASVKNNGINNLTGVQVKAEIYQNGSVVYTSLSDPIALVTPGTTVEITLNPYIPQDTGFIQISYSTIINETDQNLSNDSALSSAIYISEEELARDDGMPSGSLGIGTGNGELGLSFVLNNPGYLRDVKFYLTRNYLSVPVSANIRSFKNGYPDTIIAVTDTFYAANDSACWVTLGLPDGGIYLPADTFVVTVNEVDSTLQIAQTTTLFTPGTGWVNWPTNPLGRWGNVEEYGAQFAKSFILRPMIGPNKRVDAELTDILLPGEYTMIPKCQMYPLNLGGSVINNGSSDITNVQLKADLYQNGILIHNGISIEAPFISADSTKEFLLPSFTPADTGMIEIRYSILMNETDEVPLNDSAFAAVYVSVNELARDNGRADAGTCLEAGELGLTFVLNNPAFIPGIKFYMYSNHSPAEPFFARIRNFQNGKPGDQIAVTDTCFAPADAEGWITLSINGNPLFLQPDTIVITLNQSDCNFTIGYADTLFTAKTNWIYHGISGEWICIDSSGDSGKQFMIRPVIEQNKPVDAELISTLLPSEYTIVPGWQEYLLSIGGTIRNNGSQDITGVRLKADKFQNGVLRHSETGTGVTIKPDSAAQFTLNSYTPSDTGLVEIFYSILMNETDEDTLDNKKTVSVHVSENELARDDGYCAGNMSIGSGEGELGTSFILNKPANLSAVKFYLFKTHPGAPVFAHLRDFENGNPGNLIAVSDTFFASGSDGQWITLDMQEDTVFLPADTFAVTINEVDSALCLGQSNDIYLFHTNWVIYPQIPGGNWLNVEAFGEDNRKQFMLRPILQEVTTAAKEEEDNIPSEFSLSQNYPNPFNPETIIRFSIPNSSLVSLIVYDILGNEVSVLLNEQKEAGEYRIKFGGENISSGVYFYQLRAGSFVQTNKMILLK